MDVLGIFILLPRRSCSSVPRARPPKHGSAASKRLPGEGENRLILVRFRAVVALVMMSTLLSLSFFGQCSEMRQHFSSCRATSSRKDIQVNYDEIPLSTAIQPMLLGNRTMGVIDLVGRFGACLWPDRLRGQSGWLRVGPLGYADLFKWLQNREQFHMSLST